MDKDNGHNEESNYKIDEDTKKILKRSSLEGVVSRSDQVSSIKYLVDPGENFKGLLMRIRIPRKRTDALIMLIAGSRCYSKCDEFQDELGKTELQHVFAGMVSEEGEGRKELVDSIIGEHRNSGQKGSFSEKVKKWAGIEKAQE